ncbi:MAG: TetR/AcrR family transcriptional regulator C-terminal domain-containing protein [Lachnospiraceae bacterium]|nr:TetR/AcrR family transcriptional regulator C-terminal domain-containing protein [Lachnospiraceae bacterium]
MKRNDRRVRKTRAQLQKSLIELMKTKNIKDITVKELVDLADINRSTFYLHYNNINDILKEMEQTLVTEINQVFLTYKEEHSEEGTFQFISGLLQAIYRNLEFCQVIFGENGDREFTREIHVMVDDKIAERLKQDLGSNFKDHKYLSSYYVTGVMGMLHIWAYDDERMNPDRMAQLCYRLVMTSINYLKTLSPEELENFHSTR